MHRRLLERLLDPGHFRHIVLEHVLDPGFQRGRGRGTARAGAAHLQPDDAGVGLVAVEEDVAAILGDRGADAGVEEILDLVDDGRGVGVVVALAMDLARGGGGVGVGVGDDGRARGVSASRASFRRRSPRPFLSSKRFPRVSW